MLSEYNEMVLKRSTIHYPPVLVRTIYISSQSYEVNPIGLVYFLDTPSRVTPKCTQSSTNNK